MGFLDRRLWKVRGVFVCFIFISCKLILCFVLRECFGNLGAEKYFRGAQFCGGAKTTDFPEFASGAGPENPPKSRIFPRNSPGIPQFRDPRLAPAL